MRTMGVRAVVLLVAVALVPTSLEQDEDIPHNDVKNWALKFGAGLWEYSRYYTKIDEIKERYHNMDVEVARKDGLILIREMATEVKNMMDIKMNAVMRIMDSAEQVALSHKFEAGLKHRFLDARRFGEGAPGESDPLLDANGDQGLNTTVSAILLPPGISDSNPDVMNAIKWSEQLDPLFVSNYEMDPSLSWQYFGSASGFLRRYPASRWPGGAGERPSDFRSAAWYAGAAASPKDVLVLLDSSGSMSGARRMAAKAVVASILDMLGDNDFVNVYRFSDVTEELVPCFRDMLVQATRENIRELKNALEATKSENIANFSSALITAFELLHRYNRTGLGCQCNQAIALVTDGPSDTFSDIFKRYNEPHRPVRMFTFLVGGDSAGAKEMRTIACSNKGFYARVGSRKEAESAVLNMLYVMARPMVMYQNDHPVQWTPVYAGTRGSSSPGRSRGSSQLMTSVSAPIFDRRNYTGERVANLLGVVGTDVPVEHIQKLVQPYKLGVNGYSFIVDNNGHVLYHPDLRPLTKTPSGQEALKPDYNSVDLTEVELVDGEGGPRENNSLLLDLRHDMIDQKEGETELSVKIHYDNMKRVTTRRHKYFYNPIEGTPFSLGLAIPEGYGMYEVLGEQEIKLKPINVTDFFNGTKWKVHPDWVYCEYNYAAENRFKTPEEQVLYFLLRTRKPGWKWMSLRPRSQLKDAAHMKKMEKDSYFCDKTLVQSLVFDAVVTEGIESMERQVSSFSKDDPKTGDKKDELYGITLSFIATRSGLLRWQDYKPPGMSNDMPDPFPHFSENNQRATDEVWYKRAVDQYAIEPDSFVFSVPFDAGANSNTRVTATHALFVEHKGHRAPAAVVGLQFQHSTFASHFLKITSSCSSGQQNPSECKKTCNSEELDCYVLDDNGFIIVSESPDNTGRFFGQIDGTIMDSLVQDRIYKKVPVFDYQGACMDQKNPYSDASNRLTPLEPIKWFIRWFFGKMLWIAVQTSLYSLWDPSWAQANDDGNLYGDYETSFDNYPTREESSLFPAAGGILTETQPPLRMYPYTPVPPVHAPYTNDDNNDFQPRPCDKRVDLYILQPDRLNTSGDFNPLKGKLTNCHSTGCERPFSVQKIPQSNLILLVVDTLCPCGSKQLSIMPQEVAYDASTAAAGATGGCRNRPHEAMYRRRPPKCMNYHPEETEIKVCGGGGSTSVSPWIVMVCLGTWTISKALLS